MSNNELVIAIQMRLVELGLTVSYDELLPEITELRRFYYFFSVTEMLTSAYDQALLALIIKLRSPVKRLSGPSETFEDGAGI